MSPRWARLTGSPARARDQPRRRRDPRSPARHPDLRFPVGSRAASRGSAGACPRPRPSLAGTRTPAAGALVAALANTAAFERPLAAPARARGPLGIGPRVLGPRPRSSESSDPRVALLHVGSCVLARHPPVTVLGATVLTRTTTLRIPDGGPCRPRRRLHRCRRRGCPGRWPSRRAATSKAAECARAAGKA